MINGTNKITWKIEKDSINEISRIHKKYQSKVQELEAKIKKINKENNELKQKLLIRSAEALYHRSNIGKLYRIQDQ